MASPDADPVYDTIGRTYTATRRADPRIERQIHDAIGSAPTVVNLGAGTGNYEPTDRFVVAVEPSWTMIRQRPAGAAPAVRAVAEHLPFDDDAFEVAMAVLTLHHWTDLAAGLAEMRRVARRQVIVSFEAEPSDGHWLIETYLPEYRELALVHAAPDVPGIAEHLDVRAAEVLPIPADCADGFGGAHWCRPEAYLDPLVRTGMSFFSELDPALVDERIAQLAADLADGTWDARHGHLRTLATIDLGYRLVIAGR